MLHRNYNFLKISPVKILKHTESAFCHDFKVGCTTFFHISTISRRFGTLFLFFVPVEIFTCVEFTNMYTSSGNISKLSAITFWLNVAKLPYMTLAGVKLHLKHTKLVQDHTNMNMKCSSNYPQSKSETHKICILSQQHLKINCTHFFVECC